MGELDTLESAQLQKDFERANELLNESGIVSAEKRQLLEMLNSVQSNLAQGTDAQETTNVLSLLPIIIKACEHGIEQERVAGTDPLTGIANRRAYEDTGNITLARLTRDDIGSAALLFIDVVKFKDFNTDYGHNVGDLALVEIANTLKEAVRDTDFVARFAGDEFTVLAVHKDKGHDFTQIRNNIYNKFETASIHYEGQYLPLAVSVGIADLTRNDNLVHAQERADQDMYAEKEKQHRALDAKPDEPTHS